MADAQQKTAQRVLIYRLGSLGDTVVALPTLHLAARAFPTAERRMLTSYPPNAKAPPSSAILEHTGLIHSFFRYTYGTRNVRELLVLWWSLVRWRPQVLIYMGGTRSVASAKRDALFFRLCGIRKLIGVPITEDMQNPRTLKREVTHTASGEPALEYESSRLARNLSELGDARLGDAASWDLHLTQTEQARAAEALLAVAGCALIAASVGTKMQSKDWGPENWRALCTRIAALYPAYALVLCGAPQEAEASEIVAAGWRAVSDKPALNLCGALTPRESAAVYAKAALFLGHDSGPMHLAASVQTPCVAVFSARNLPRVWFPYGARHRVVYHHVDCQNCDLEVCTIQKKKCILSITVDEVLSNVIGVLPPGKLEPMPHVRL